ncbi:MAG: ATP-binding protein [Candidatus Aenigmarchaeota archaeon]|nr:ATP-binding protein [Candidatus Aenigmarchaeota archaeon]
MDSRILKEIILQQKKEFEKKEDFVRRDILDKIENYIKLPHAIVISGMRRSGKSTLLKEIKTGFYKDKTIYYFNFEDEHLINFTVEDFNLLYEAFVELFGKHKTFFFDEIQNIKGWELFVRRMYDRGFKFILTGSNSSMLSRELGSRLTGRYISIELYPFSFKEFISFKEIVIPDHILTEERALIKSAFNDYLKNGGIPEYLIYNNNELLKTLYENILYRDILVRYGLNDEKSLKELAHYIFSNYATEISYNKLKAMLNVGSLNTVKNYIHYLENSYLVFTVPKYEYSLKKQIYSRKKIYVIDNSLINLISFGVSQNTGNILENLVFIELKRRNNNIYYHKDKYECDFIITENKTVLTAIQVTLNLKNNKEREYRGLLEALDKYKLDTGLILTENEEYEEIVQNKKIIIKPIWKWLLDL